VFVCTTAVGRVHRHGARRVDPPCPPATWLVSAPRLNYLAATLANATEIRDEYPRLRQVQHGLNTNLVKTVSTKGFEPPGDDGLIPSSCHRVGRGDSLKWPGSRQEAGRSADGMRAGLVAAAGL
jgi:hypothetical protein